MVTVTMVIAILLVALAPPPNCTRCSKSALVVDILAADLIHHLYMYVHVTLNNLLNVMKCSAHGLLG